MYTSKSFRVVDEKEIFNQIDSLSQYSDHVKKIFLADGNAMVLSFGRMMRLLDKLNSVFPKLSRISAYALPSDIENKSLNELQELNNAGLKLLYTGIETGDDELLKIINKSETSQSTISGLTKAREAGIKLSVMIINGLGGEQYSMQHMINSAKVINSIQPEYLSTLVLSYPYGEKHYKKRFKCDFTALNKLGLIKEMGNFIQNLELGSTVFRSDHASNYLILKGILNRDKNKLLENINEVINNPDDNFLRPEWMRGL